MSTDIVVIIYKTVNSERKKGSLHVEKSPNSCIVNLNLSQPFLHNLIQLQQYNYAGKAHSMAHSLHKQSYSKICFWYVRSNKFFLISVKKTATNNEVFKCRKKSGRVRSIASITLMEMCWTKTNNPTHFAALYKIQIVLTTKFTEFF